MALILDGTNGVSGVNGTASTPALQGSDSNTGISFGTDTVTINTGGTARVTTDVSGNVGIGTASPNTAAIGGTALTINNADQSVFEISRANARAYYTYVSSAGSRIAEFRNLPLTFFTNDTERMRIDSSGNLGLGVTPSAWGTSGSAYKAIQFGVSGSLYGRTGNETAVLASGVYFDAAGPKYLLSGNFASSYSQASGAHIWFTAPSGTAGNAISFTQAMTLDASGNLLVGTTALPFPGGGKVNSVTGSSNQAIVTSFSGADGTSVGIWSNYANTTGGAYHAYFTYNQVGVGLITSTSTTTSYITTSDYRLKENIAPMTGALAKVAQLKPCTYTWKTDGSAGQGFIAHELQAVVPDCVTGEKDAVDKDGKPQYQGVDTSFLVATLVSAIQEQQTLIQSLTSRLEALENK